MLKPGMISIQISKKIGAVLLNKNFTLQSKFWKWNLNKAEQPMMPFCYDYLSQVLLSKIDFFFFIYIIILLITVRVLLRGNVLKISLK